MLSDILTKSFEKRHILGNIIRTLPTTLLEIFWKHFIAKLLS